MGISVFPALPTIGNNFIIITIVARTSKDKQQTIKKLTAKQHQFAREFIVDLNATAAYQRVYGCSEAVARASASRLLADVNISSYIQQLQQQRSHRTQITADRVLTEIARVAFSNITDVVEFDESGVRFKSSTEIDDEVKSAIVEVSSDVTYSRGGEDGEMEPTVKRKVKMHNKLQALDLLAKHLGLTSDFNQAIAVLQTYGIQLKQGNDGWFVENAKNTSTPEG